MFFRQTESAILTGLDFVRSHVGPIFWIAFIFREVFLGRGIPIAHYFSRDHMDPVNQIMGGYVSMKKWAF